MSHRLRRLRPKGDAPPGQNKKKANLRSGARDANRGMRDAAMAIVRYVTYVCTYVRCPEPSQDARRLSPALGGGITGSHSCVCVCSVVWCGVVCVRMYVMYVCIVGIRGSWSWFGLGLVFSRLAGLAAASE